MNLDDINYGKQEFENIVFVDIDGVLNHSNMDAEYRFLKESVEALNELYESHKIQIVISSSWKNAYAFSFLQKLFIENGIKAPVIDKTFTFFSKIENNNSFSLNEMETQTEDVHYE